MEKTHLNVKCPNCGDEQTEMASFFNHQFFRDDEYFTDYESCTEPFSFYVQQNAEE